MLKKDHLLTDDANDRRYFTIVPNIIWEKGLSVHDLWLYATIKRVAGENGECYMSSRKLSELAGMSIGIVSGSKGSLAQAGLIEITLEKRSEKGWAVHHIKVVDIWGENMAHFANCSPHEQITKECSPDDQNCSPHEPKCSPGDTEEDPLNKISKEDRKEEEETSPETSERNIFALYEDIGGKRLTEMVADELKAFAAEIPDASWITEAGKIASKNGVGSWAYVRAILERWIAAGSMTDPPKRRQANEPTDTTGMTQEQVRDYYLGGKYGHLVKH